MHALGIRPSEHTCKQQNTTTPPPRPTRYTSTLSFMFPVFSVHSARHNMCCISAHNTTSVFNAALSRLSGALKKAHPNHPNDFVVFKVLKSILSSLYFSFVPAAVKYLDILRIRPLKFSLLNHLFSSRENHSAQGSAVSPLLLWDINRTSQ